MMEELEQEMWLAELEYERKQDAKVARKHKEEKARQKKAAKLRAQLLEGAFDGEMDMVKEALDEGADVEVADGAGHTALSEASAGGQMEIAMLLADKGADPNSRGQFGRTPLWRACFAGHNELAVNLLEIGADPRLSDDSGGTPASIASTEELKTTIAEWDIEETERLMAGLAKLQAFKKQQAMVEREEAKEQLAGGMEETLKAHKDAQAGLKKFYRAYNDRIYEYDISKEENKSDTIMKAALQAVNDSEAALEDAKEKATECQDAYDFAKSNMMDFNAEDEVKQELPGIKIRIQDIGDVLLKDIGGKIAADGRWPLVADVSKRANMFLRYRDVNYVNACSSHDMSPEVLRKAILGALRYGKNFVLDVMDVDLGPQLVEFFEAIEPGLYKSIMNKSLLKNEKYATLIKPHDDEQYSANNFQADKVKDFQMIVTTHARKPTTELMDQFFVISVSTEGT